MTSSHKATAGLALVLSLTLLAYWPGLSGGYLFDDFVNLNAIGATGPVDNWITFFRYVTSGTADPTGRPLALMSFLIDARDWPADPAPFLQTNLVLHLLNGSLLFLLLRALGRHLDKADRRNDASALLGSGLWLLHPLLVSTTLYAVQREAMLPATFILLGLLTYITGREMYLLGKTRRGMFWMVVGIFGGTAFALLCKANGIVLPVLAWVLETSILRRCDAFPAAPGLRRIRLLLITLPSLALIVYLGGYLQHPNLRLDQRGWSIAQRLLTESRVVTDYLQLLVVPRSVSTGLYNDSYVVSTSLLRPASTLPCVLLILFLAIFSWRAKARVPTLSAALLFFLSGHLLESTVVPLEIYFEHRNYVPAMLLFWPLARGIAIFGRDARLQVAIALGLLLLFGATTFERARLWGNPSQLAELWTLQNPGSSRAQATVAMLETKAGRPELALGRLGPIWMRNPGDLQIAFNYVNASCALDGLSGEDSRSLESALRSSRTGFQLIHGWLEQAIELAESGQCRGLTLADTARWVAAARQNTEMRRMGTVRQNVEPLLAQLAISRGQPNAALAHFDQSLAAFVSPDAAARQASVLARHGYYRQALAHLDTYDRLQHLAAKPGLGMPWIHAEVLRRQGYWPKEMAVLRAKLKDSLQTRAQGGKPAVYGP